ncbi:MAG: imidazolonepropionase, partial [Acidiferrobacteraceae bacterium]|nr:imidazolonepropionase [Acidiferrobacteraceae bacterium]
MLFEPPVKKASVRLWENARIASMAGTLPGADVVNNGALLTHEDRIIAVGSAEEVLAHPSATNASMLDRIDCKHQLLLPGFIDCHTHLVYAGDRSREFEQRLEGVSYEEIARQGGGIRSTVKDTRKSAQEDLVKGALGRAKRMCSEGVTTIEVKGGYGLTLECEQKMLRVARSLETVLPVSVHTTFLGAHAVPEEFEGRSDDYIDLVCSVMLPEIAKEGLADSVDAFCENIAFSEPQVRAVFEKAHALGLPVRLHADQLSNSHGARLAAEFSALSADHLEYTDEAGVRALKQAGTVAVLLPGAFYFLKEQQRPPVNLFRKHQVPMALASDCNPGSSPVESLLLILNMGCVLFGLTPREAVAGVTVHAAKALGYADRGVLAAGKRADFAV